MALAVLGAERASVRLVVGRQAFVFALNDAFVAVGLVLAPGAWLPIAYVIGVGLAQARTSLVQAPLQPGDALRSASRPAYWSPWRSAEDSLLPVPAC